MFDKLNFDQCAFNPLTDGHIITAYPQMQEILTPEMEEEEKLDNLIRYVVMVYDPRSPIYLNEKDMRQRKMVAAELAGFDMEDGDSLQRLYNNEYGGLVSLELTTGYLKRFAKSMEWAAIQAFETTYWESITELMKPIAGKSSREILDSVQKKSAIKAEVDNDIKRLEAYYKMFFGQDEELVRKRRSTPEAMAKR